jgi:hypothetical protein
VSPPFCIPALGLTTQVTQIGCGVGEIASQGGADYTVHEVADTSFSGGSCDTTQASCTLTGIDTSLAVRITVGDGTPDTCTSGTGNAILTIPVHTLTWKENVPTGQPGECPAADGRYDADTSMGDTTPDQLVTEFDQNLDFTTDSSTTKWDDLDGDGCAISGQGPPAGYGTGAGGEPPCANPACTGVCMDFDAKTVTNVASGGVGSNSFPYDISFLTFLPNTYTGPVATAPATCTNPPAINFAGTADRCITPE